jgi:hypothetical protein
MMKAASHLGKFVSTQAHGLVALGLLLPFVLGEAQPVSGQPTNDQPPTITSMTPNPVMRGGIVTVKGNNFPVDPTKITVLLTGTEASQPPLKLTPSTAHNDSFVFQIPWNAECDPVRHEPCPLGAYAMEARFEGKPPPLAALAPDLLQLVSSAGNDVKITAVFPVVSYPYHETFGFSILGEGFSRVPNDNILVVENIGEPHVTWFMGVPPLAEANKKYDRLSGWVVSSRELVFRGLPQSMQGKVNLRVRVGARLSEPFPIILAQVPYWVPFGVAAGSLLVLAGCLFGLIRSGVSVYRVVDKTYGLAQAFFIDPETDTYSLSKFQFYWWTALAIFGYVYLTIARSLIQGVFEFAPLPSGLPSLLLVSATTKVLAQGITSLRGPKGAGDIHPSFADFVTTGGIVSAERTQFFVWTLIGGLGFLFLVLARDPGNVQDLPSLPDSFLALMGISSVGYLGGKVVRKPGPVINEVGAKTEGESAHVEIHGRNLSRNAGVRIDTDDITLLRVLDPPTPDDKDTQTQEPDMYTVLRMDITNFAKTKDLAWQQSPHTLTITNPDGQTATSWPFTFTSRENTQSVILNH